MALIDLSKVSGLPLQFDDETNKIVSHDVLVPKPDVRTIDQMRDVLLDRDITEPKELYYMYRDIKLAQDVELFKKHHVRYDITVIPPNRLGREWVKTAGHYHPHAEGTTVEYPEIYHVLHGTAHYLFQKRKGERVVEVMLVVAHTGDKVIIPPGYGHITINASSQTLVMANLVSGDFSSDYGPIKKKHGGAYLGMVRGEGIEFVKEPFYNNPPELKHAEPKYYPDFGPEKGTPLYHTFVDKHERFAFLNNPQDYEY